jgi:Poly(ADP-ribose) polymerase catalytic domain
LEKTLIPEINEYFLLHGTKKDLTEIIQRDGLDGRLNENGMMGPGVYFAERSTKADQYTGNMHTLASVFFLFLFQWRTATIKIKLNLAC